MRISVFTSNQPRHVALIEALASVADEVIAVQECTTLFPGAVADFFRKSEVMQRYFAKVIDAERAEFGPPRPLPAGVRSMPMRMGDLIHFDERALEAVLEADLFVVFGSSFIRGPLCRRLVERRAINIHMGVSPYYRGSSCNFWALYDKRPEMVGATIHLLSEGLDSGPMLMHALPATEDCEPFALGMRAVRAAQFALVQAICSGEIMRIDPVAQDKSKALRYTRNADFSDEAAQEYLERAMMPTEVGNALRAAAREKDGRYLRPVFAG